MSNSNNKTLYIEGHPSYAIPKPEVISLENTINTIMPNGNPASFKYFLATTTTKDNKLSGMQQFCAATTESGEIDHWKNLMTGYISDLDTKTVQCPDGRQFVNPHEFYARAAHATKQHIYQHHLGISRNMKIDDKVIDCANGTCTYSVKTDGSIDFSYIKHGGTESDADIVKNCFQNPSQ